MVVLQGALNSIWVFLPMMPPSTVSGKVTSAQMTRMITIVPNGSAAVDCALQTHHQGVAHAAMDVSIVHTSASQVGF